jgi:hypothetical protein
VFKTGIGWSVYNDYMDLDGLAFLNALQISDCPDGSNSHWDTFDTIDCHPNCDITVTPACHPAPPASPAPPRPPPAPPAPPGAPPPLQAGPFSVHDTFLLSWTDAREACVALGGALATITSSDLNAQLHGLLGHSSEGEQYWIGADDIGSEGKPPTCAALPLQRYKPAIHAQGLTTCAHWQVTGFGRTARNSSTRTGRRRP